MHLSPPSQRILKLVFAVSSAQGSLNRPRLERRSGLGRAELKRVLDQLADLGLLDAQRLRLTLNGLAVAVASGARAKPARRPRARRAGDSSAMPAPIALFSQREPPRAVA